MKVVFFGTPDFSVGCLSRLNEEHQIVAVVTQPDRAGNRGKVTFPPVKEEALRLGLPVMQFEKVRDQVNLILDLHADIGVTAAYGQILPQALLDAFPKGIINVHASLLPKYRGSSPIHWAIVNGERETGITIMQTAIGVDCGDILGVTKVKIEDDDTAETLFDKLSRVAPDILIETMQKIERGQITPLKQVEQLATHFPMLSKEMGKIDWTMSAEQIRNRIRGFYPWPCAWTTLDGRVCKIISAQVLEGRGAAGSVIRADKQGLTIACGKDALLLTRICVQGNKAMSSADYLRGHAVEVGTVLC